MTFQVATGHDNAAGLTEVSPQPQCHGIKYPVVRYAADGSQSHDGYAYAEWIYGYMTRAKWAAFLSALGATITTKSIAVTVRTVKNDLASFANYNATAILPDIDDAITPDRGKWLDIVITFTNLEAL